MSTVAQGGKAELTSFGEHSAPPRYCDQCRRLSYEIDEHGLCPPCAYRAERGYVCELAQAIASLLSRELKITIFVEPIGPRRV